MTIMLDKAFNPQEAEPRLYEAWEQSGAFKPLMDTSREAYCIVNPPPNVTGSLHMGHALNNTLQDILIRFERMRGKDVLWQVGMDHAGIATQMVVERKLAAEGNMGRKDMSREDFVAKVWEWKAESGGTITKQLRRLGASCDWSREKFTLGDPENPDDKMAEAVTKAFVDLYNDGLIYRDKRLVNWDPHFQTAISDLEVESRDKDGHFWHFKYPLDGGETYTYVEKDEDGNVVLTEERDYISIATTRPETMLGDGAVAVHLDDERYAPIVGKLVRLPLADRLIPIITDEYPDPEFGSGAVKITGAHDFNDYEVAKRAGLPLYSLMDERACMIQSPDKDGNSVMPEKYVGMDRFAARKAVVADIDAQGLLIKIEDKKVTQPFGDRSGVVIEPFLTDQWYVNAEEIAKRAIEMVDDGSTKFFPANWKKTYDHWMKDIQPWCISRQLSWGHRIPAWYGEDGRIFVGNDEAETREIAKKHYGKEVNLSQDNDVLDTWFSSGLWPFSTLGWPEETEHLERFYPTNVLITGFDIIFFWVARMMMQGLYFMDDIPFKDVYIHALVRDEQGKKMSKSEGNVIDPIDLIQGIDIDGLVSKRTTGLRQPEKAPKVEKSTRKAYPDGFEAYGADALRFTLAAMAGMGRDISLSVERVAGYRNFGSKIWNAAKFGEMNDCKPDTDFDPSSCTQAVNQWIVSEVAATANEVTNCIEKYRFNDAADAIYKFAWGTFCAWYLELVKPSLDSDDEARKTETRACFAWCLDTILKLLHPFMPFISEELWGQISENRSEPLILTAWPDLSGLKTNSAAQDDINWLISTISEIRSVRAEANIPPANKSPLIVVGASDATKTRMETYIDVLAKMARVDGWSIADEAPKNAIQAIVDEAIFAMPLAGLIDLDAEKDRIQKKIAELDAEIEKVDKKLANKSFVDRAPEAVVAEQHARKASFVDERDKLSSALESLGS
jgi:valyl-tRNA synthetase